MSSPIPITQSGQVILTYPVTFTSGYNSSAAPVAAAVTGVPTGLTVNPTQSATTGTPAVKLTIMAGASEATGTTTPSSSSWYHIIIIIIIIIICRCRCAERPGRGHEFRRDGVELRHERRQRGSRIHC